MEKKKVKKVRTEVKVNDWVVLEKKGVVLYAVKSRGQIIVGKAKCGVRDTFDLEVGKQIAYKRCELKQRTRDLELVKQFIACQENMVDYLTNELNQNLLSRNFQRALLKGYLEQKIQYKNIHRLKKEIKELCNQGNFDEDNEEEVYFASADDAPSHTKETEEA